jgi:F0F1-type ATP synthase assembly protein I
MMDWLTMFFISALLVSAVIGYIIGREEGKKP